MPPKSGKAHGSGAPNRPSACSKVARSRMNSDDAIMERVRGRGNETVSSNATRPGRGVRTITRSARKTASSTSWVTSSTEDRSCSHSAASHACRSERVKASSAPKHTARKLSWVGIAEAIETKAPELRCRPLLGIRARHSGCLEPQSGVACSGSPGKQQVTLLHVRRTAEALLCIGRLPIQTYGAAILGDEPGDDVEQRALARSRLPN